MFYNNLVELTAWSPRVFVKGHAGLMLIRAAAHHHVMSMNNIRTYEIFPLTGVGSVNFGMHRNEVQTVMPEISVPFRKTRLSKVETDAYHEAGFQVFYNTDTLCVEYIELSRGCTFKAELYGIDPFEKEAGELIEFLSEIDTFDESNPELGYSYIFPTIELSIWRPVTNQKYFSTLGIGRKGYYSKTNS